MDVEAVTRAMKDIDIVVHCAADMTFYPKNEAALFRTNVDGSKRVAEAALAANVKHFLFVSSYESLGPGAFNETNRSEISIPNPVYPYGKSKLLVNEYLTLLAQEHPEFHFTTLLLPGVIAPDETSTTFHEQLYWSCNMGLFFFTPWATSWCQYVHVEDAIEGITLAMKNAPTNGRYLIVPNDAMRYSDVIRISCRELGRVQPFLRLPYVVVRVAMLALKPPMSLFFDKTCLFHEVTVDQLIVSRHFTNAKAKNELNFHPKWTMEEAVVDGIRGRLRTGRLKRYPIAPLWPLLLVALVFLFFRWFF
jgi:dihydroflavonol-4-reductase